MAERSTAEDTMKRIALIAASAQGMGNDEQARTDALDQIICLASGGSGEPTQDLYATIDAQATNIDQLQARNGELIAKLKAAGGSGEVPAGLTREHLRVALAACEEIEAEGWRETSDAFRETRRALRAALEESPIQAVLREEEAERDSWGRAALRGQEEETDD